MHPTDEVQRGTASEPAVFAPGNDFPSSSFLDRKHLFFVSHVALLGSFSRIQALTPSTPAPAAAVVSIRAANSSLSSGLTAFIQPNTKSLSGSDSCSSLAGTPLMAREAYRAARAGTTARGNQPFDEIPGEVMRFPQDNCDFERTSGANAVVEPRDAVKGEIAN